MTNTRLKKRLFIWLSALTLILSSCTNTRPSSDTPSKETDPASIAPSEVEPDAPAMEIKSPYQADPAAVADKTKDFYKAPEAGSCIEIILKDNATEAKGKGVVVTGNTVLINEKGSYMLTGTLTDGRILIAVSATDDVVLYLNNADITSKTSAPIYVRSADKAVISLMPGTVNKLTDAMSSSDSGTALTAALFSKADMTINGTGKLLVYANAKDGVTSKDDLKIMEGEIEIHSKDDGIVGHDSFVMKGGTLNVDAGGDGVKSSKEEAGKGFVLIGGGTLNVQAAADGIDASTSIRISDGNVNVSSGGGSGAKVPMQGFDFANWGSGNTNSAATQKSTKGLKAGYYIDITGGVIVIDALENAISAKGAIHVFGGAIRPISGNDAIHTESDFYMVRGIINTDVCEEAIEGATVTIEGGVLSAASKDDCINANGYNDKTNKLAPGGYSHNADAGDEFDGASIVITGGKFTFAPLGDGIDSNGSIAFRGGQMTMTGPLSTDEGAFDYLSTFELSGGEFICLTSAQHVNKPTDAKQAYLTLTGFTGAAGDQVEIRDASGKTLLKTEAKIGWQAVYASSASFAAGQNYKVLVNGKEVNTAPAVQ